MATITAKELRRTARALSIETKGRKNREIARDIADALIAKPRILVEPKPELTIQVAPIEPIKPKGRGRGRPRKPRTPEELAAEAAPKRGRGRPKKVQEDGPVEVDQDFMPVKRRGRPRKDATAELRAAIPQRRQKAQRVDLIGDSVNKNVIEARVKKFGKKAPVAPVSPPVAKNGKAKRKIKATDWAGVAERHNPYRTGTNNWHIANELIIGGTRQDVIKRLHEKIDFSRQDSSSEPVDFIQTANSRLNVIGRELERKHGMNYEYGNGFTDYLQVIPDGYDPLS